MFETGYDSVQDSTVLRISVGTDIGLGLRVAILSVLHRIGASGTLRIPIVVAELNLPVGNAKDFTTENRDIPCPPQGINGT